MHWSKAYIVGWALMFVGFLFYEFWAGWGPGKHTPMLTQVVVRWIPSWITLPAIIWLFCHFAVRYADPAYRAWLRSKS